MADFFVWDLVVTLLLSARMCVFYRVFPSRLCPGCRGTTIPEKAVRSWPGPRGLGLASIVLMDSEHAGSRVCYTPSAVSSCIVADWGVRVYPCQVEN